MPLSPGSEPVTADNIKLMANGFEALTADDIEMLRTFTRAPQKAARRSVAAQRPVTPAVPSTRRLEQAIGLSFEVGLFAGLGGCKVVRRGNNAVHEVA